MENTLLKLQVRSLEKALKLE